MALIGKIRKNMWLVIILLALALAGFVIMDMLGSRRFGGGINSSSLGEVAGEDVDVNDFQRVESALYGNSLDEATRKNSVWTYFVEKAIIDKISDANGIGVGKDELAELEFGENLSPITQGYFRDPQTGQVDRAELANIKTAIDEDKVTNPEFANRFNELRKQVIKLQKQTKLNNLVSKSLYTPDWMATTLEKLNNESANIELVKIGYEDFPAGDVKVSDEEIAAYIKENPKKFSNKEEVRNIVFAEYNVVPSAADSAKYMTDMKALAEEFKTSTRDSLFATSNNGFYPAAYSAKKDITGSLKDVVGTLANGTVYGPYIDNNVLLVAKLIDKKVLPDSAKASHILRRVENNDPVQMAAAKQYIDSLRNIIKSGSISFADAATTNSQDPGSAAKGGDLGTFGQGMMVPEFNDAVFNGKAGELYEVTTQFGVHLIKVEKLISTSSEPKYKVAYIAQPIIASDETQEQVLNKAMAALESSKTIEGVTPNLGSATFKEAGGIKINDYVVGDLGGEGQSRDIIKWAYEHSTKPGDVSPTVYTYKDKANYVDSKYVIAGLKSIDKAGLASVESGRKTAEPILLNKKKAELIKAKISGSDLAAIATTFNTKVDTVASLLFARGMIPNGGSEPKVVGKIFKMTGGTVSAPMEGESGVYVVKVNSITPPAASDGAFMVKSLISQGVRQQVNYRLIDSLKKAAKIEDKRYKFF